jgi:hypothetical protein
MTLKEKFEQWFINDEDEHYEGMVELVSIEHEKIADEFAIGFAEWYFKKAEKYNSHLKLVADTKKILEIYKKEKGL